MATFKERYPGIATLSEPERQFVIDEGKEWGHGTNNKYLDGIDSVLRAPGQISLRLQAGTEKLNVFRVQKMQQRSERVKGAWYALAAFASRHTEESEKHGLITMVYGSTVFNDPVNLDYDVSVFSLKSIEPLKDAIIYDWNDELDRTWPGDGGHLTVVEWSKIAGNLESAIGDKTGKWAESGIPEEVDMGPLSTALTGEPVYTPSKKDLNNLRSAIARFAAAIPLVGAMIIFDIEETIKTRLERRRR